jgi:putative ABC transport system permease protein
MMLGISRQTVRHTWRPYAGAFVALSCGILLIAVTVTLVGSVDATAGQRGASAADRAQLDELAALFGFMASVSLFMAVFVVASTFGFVVATRRRELGLLRLVGATPGQVRRLILGESAVVALLATVAGCLAATALTPAVLWLLRARSITDLDLQAPAPWLAWAVAAPSGAGVALVGAWRASRRASRVAPVAALAEAAVERRRVSVWQALIGSACAATVVAVLAVSTRMEPLFALIVAILLPEVIVIGLVCFGGVVFPPLAALLARPFVGRDVAARLARDQVRTGSRTATSLAAPIVAISSVAGSMILALSFTVDWTSALDRAQLEAPLVVEAGDATALGALGADPTVAVLDPRLTVRIPLGGQGVEDVDAVDVAAASAARGLRAVQGDLDALHGRTLAVSETWVFDSGRGLGDTIQARVDGERVRLRVVAVVSDAPDLYGDLIVPRDLVARQVETGGPGRPGPVFVVPRDDVTVAAARDSLEQTLAGTSSRVLSSDAWIAEVDQQTRDANDLALWVLLGPAGLYAAIAIVNAILIGVSQRRRELRVVRLLGATRAQVRRMATWEASLVGGAALVVGAVVTGFVGWLVRRATTADVPQVPMTLPWLPLTGVALTCAALTLVAALVGARGSHR